ncbi:arsenate reductase family protein [Falsirhodobacter halotolerans]|uniref:arsenate reductase family protein n=1 Tax=Falsirhodobacter halotolerans TaxID=1146892 RepID=UPI001FD0882E|nr:ArsC/Spx/MgsR family protein [Falsirhodobacter halotolerans]MCJ8139788.1 arsenate reductase [Falsirhodobacter halotolerans]
MKLYGLGTCDTCRKAIRELSPFDPEFQDVRKTPLSRPQIDALLEIFGDELVNRKSTTWRGLSDTEKAMTAGDLLVAYPTLMKRPVIEHDGRHHLGWGAATQAALLR